MWPGRTIDYLVGPALMLAMIVVLVMLAEFVLRLVAPQPLLGKGPRYEAVDGDEVYQLVPNQDLFFPTLDGGFHIVTSPSGNRGHDPHRMVDVQLKQLVFCGDSFCFGNGVENHQTIPSQVDELLGQEVRTYNIGQPGYSLPQTRARLAGWLDRWHADRVVLILFVGNDFHDCDPDRLASIRVDREGNLVIGDEPFETGFDAGIASVKSWLWSSSMLYSLVRRLIADLRKPPYEPELLFDASLPTGDSTLAGIVEAELLDMAGLCGEHGTNFTILLLPALVQVDDDWWAAFDTSGKLDRWGPQLWLLKLCETAGIKCIDLAPVLTPLQRSAFLPTDRHLTPGASGIVASILANIIGML